MTRNIYSVYYRTLTTVKGELIPQLVEQQFRQWSEAYTRLLRILIYKCGSDSSPLENFDYGFVFFYEQWNLL